MAGGESLLAPALTRRLVERFVQSPPPCDGAPPALAELSEREVEVTRLVARVRSNREIGKELFIGEATVKTHVSRILQKLGLRDRIQVVVAAYESGLVRAGAPDS